MKKLCILSILLTLLIFPVSAMEFQPPTAPESAHEYMPADTESFSEGLWYVLKTAIADLQPALADACGICLSLIAVAVLISLLHSFSGSAKSIVELVGTLAVGLLLLKPSGTLIQLGASTVAQLSEYGKLLLPVMTAALAAQGGTASSAALYTGTALFNAILSTAISKLLVPMVYIYLCLCIANSAIGRDILKNLSSFVKWLMTWTLKIILYIFTGYISITGVVSGTADAAAVRAAKLAISGFVPVVGNIISDASETILVSAGFMKSAAGIYGLLAILSVWIGPFLQIGIQYLLLKVTAAVCGVFGVKPFTALVQNFSAVMGFLLAMTGALCLLLIISTVCFMRGVG